MRKSDGEKKKNLNQNKVTLKSEEKVVNRNRPGNERDAQLEKQEYKTVIILKKFKEKHEHIEIADIKFLETKNTLSEIKTSLDELNNRL